MKYFTRMYVLDALAQLFKPLHNLGKLEGHAALLSDSCGEVAIAAKLH